MERDVIFSVQLQPVFWDQAPEVRIEFNREVLHDNLIVDSTRTFDFVLPAQDKNRFSIFLLNKTDADCVNGQDKAVKVTSIGIENFFFESIMHKTCYEPQYSSGYFQYAKENNISVEPKISSNYIGFLGEWYLEFTWPTFTWLHNVETDGLGWVYEKNI